MQWYSILIVNLIEISIRNIILKCCRKSSNEKKNYLLFDIDYKRYIFMNIYSVFILIYLLDILIVGIYIIINIRRKIIEFKIKKNIFKMQRLFAFFFMLLYLQVEVQFILRELSFFFKLYGLIFDILIVDEISIIVVILSKYFNNILKYWMDFEIIYQRIVK